jgi:hypothetical protein
VTHRDPGAANGGPITEPGWCTCSHLEPLHRIGLHGRTRCEYANCGCTRYRERPAGFVIQFPGAGRAPAPAGPPVQRLDLDAVADRWTDLLDARHRLEQFGRPEDAETVRHLEAALAEDVPLLREEIHRLTVALRGGA